MLLEADKKIWAAVSEIRDGEIKPLEKFVPPLMKLRGDIHVEFLRPIYKKYPKIAELAGFDVAALANNAAEGLLESRQANIDTLALLATLGRGRTSGEASCPTGRNLVIGRGADLAKPGALGPGEYKLAWPSKLPDWRAEWKENAGRLREAMGQGNPIRDASPLDTKKVHF